MEKRWIVRLVVAVGFVASASVAPRSAEACGGGDWEFQPAVDYRPQGLDKSEQDMHEGNHLTAAARILRMFPELRKAKLGVDPKIDRAYRLLSIATARAGGSLAVDKEVPEWAMGSWAGKTEKDRSANLTWAVASMRRLNEVKKDDPALQTELGEVLARVDGHQDEAREILGKLAQKDLIASPEGYAALAMLRGKSGDAAGRDAAMKKCQAMAKTQSTCGDDRVAGTPAPGGRS
jgi:hypothetical protein